VISLGFAGSYPAPQTPLHPTLPNKDQREKVNQIARMRVRMMKCLAGIRISGRQSAEIKLNVLWSATLKQLGPVLRLVVLGITGIKGSQESGTC